MWLTKFCLEVILDRCQIWCHSATLQQFRRQTGPRPQQFADQWPSFKLPPLIWFFLPSHSGIIENGRHLSTTIIVMLLKECNVALDAMQLLKRTPQSANRICFLGPSLKLEFDRIRGMTDVCQTLIVQIARSRLYCRFEHRPAGRKVGTSSSEVHMDTHMHTKRKIPGSSGSWTASRHLGGSEPMHRAWQFSQSFLGCIFKERPAQMDMEKHQA